MYDSVSDFKLIQDDNYVDVFVQVDKDAIGIWNRFDKEILHEKNFKKRQENYLKLKKEFRSYVVSVPEKFANEFIRPTKNSSIFLLPYGNLKNYYDKNTGFNRNLETIFIAM